jgi:hypothetical protein
MKHHTQKRAAIEREYREAKKLIHDEMIEDNGYIFCRGCGTTSGRISWSHRIPRSRRADLIADKGNIDPMCQGCHEKVEAGKYGELDNGVEIVAYIAKNEPELLELKRLRANH